MSHEVRITCSPILFTMLLGSNPISTIFSLSNVDFIVSLSLAYAARIILFTISHFSISWSIRTSFSFHSLLLSVLSLLCFASLSLLLPRRFLHSCLIRSMYIPFPIAYAIVITLFPFISVVFKSNSSVCLSNIFKQ